MLHVVKLEQVLAMADKFTWWVYQEQKKRTPISSGTKARPYHRKKKKTR